MINSFVIALIAFFNFQLDSPSYETRFQAEALLYKSTFLCKRLEQSPSLHVRSTAKRVGYYADLGLIQNNPYLFYDIWMNNKNNLPDREVLTRIQKPYDQQNVYRGIAKIFESSKDHKMACFGTPFMITDFENLEYHRQNYKNNYKNLKSQQSVRV